MYAADSIYIYIFFKQICFIVCISANITHLKDNRFATLNAYESEEVRNSKHSMLDTDMWSGLYYSDHLFLNN